MGGFAKLLGMDMAVAQPWSRQAPTPPKRLRLTLPKSVAFSPPEAGAQRQKLADYPRTVARERPVHPQPQCLTKRLRRYNAMRSVREHHAAGA